MNSESNILHPAHTFERSSWFSFGLCSPTLSLFPHAAMWNCEIVIDYLSLSHHLLLLLKGSHSIYISFTSWKRKTLLSLHLSLFLTIHYPLQIYSRSHFSHLGHQLNHLSLVLYPINCFSLWVSLHLVVVATWFHGCKMKCFFFKEKSKSAPELHKKKTPAVNRAANSTGSVSSPKSVKDLYREKEHSFRVFTLQELRDATNGFNRMLKLGEGGFGSVYKGSITQPDGQGGDPIPVAIKRLNTRGFQVYIYTYSHSFQI